MKNYTNEEIRYIWLDGFLGLEYKSKCEIIEYIKCDKDLRITLIEHKGEIISIIGEKEFSTLLNASAEIYIKYLLILEMT